tara:strand:- start:852 stop:1811 length:960 start_codon:yes stop_codon:yes gene_type:complete
MGDNNGEVVKKRRGRKPKSQILLEQQNNVIIEEKPSAPKKRGRKPKGGKIITELENKNNDDNVEHNVILHLKCNSDDLNIIEKDNLPESFQITSQVKAAELNFNSIDEENIHEKINEKVETNNTENLNTTNIQMKTIWKKIKELQKLFYFNNVFSKKSACFWCTCEFDNPAIYIPKYQMNDNYHVYGCFCSPECSVSYLMNENIDTSQKFERYQMLNYIYGKAYNYSKNIQPAPSPYYLLDKYFGNLSIQEYRKLLSNERLLIVIDKPLTRIFPEIHEENNDFISNKNSVVPSNSSFQIKKKSTSNNTKTNSLTEKFGF